MTLGEHVLAHRAAILLATGYKLAAPAVMRAAWKAGYENFLPFAATIVGVVALDLLKGVVAGLAVAIALAVRRALGRAVEVEKKDEHVVVKLVPSSSMTQNLLELPSMNS